MAATHEIPRAEVVKRLALVSRGDRAAFLVKELERQGRLIPVSNLRGTFYSDSQVAEIEAELIATPGKCLFELPAVRGGANYSALEAELAAQQS